MQNSVEAANVKKTKHNIFKTVCKPLTKKNRTQHFQNSARGTKQPKNHTRHI